MGLVSTSAIFRNPRNPEAKPISVEVLADSGALHLCITRELADELGLEELKSRTVELADGTTQEVPYVGPIHLEVCGRECFTGALVLGNQIFIRCCPNGGYGSMDFSSPASGCYQSRKSNYTDVFCKRDEEYSFGG